MDSKDCIGFKSSTELGSSMTASQRQRKLRFDEERDCNAKDQRELAEYAKEVKRSVRERPFYKRLMTPEETDEEESTDEILR